MNVDRNLLQRALDALLDVQLELEEPEIAELITLALDRKIADSIREMRGALGQ